MKFLDNLFNEAVNLFRSNEDWFFIILIFILTALLLFGLAVDYDFTMELVVKAYKFYYNTLNAITKFFK